MPLENPQLKAVQAGGPVTADAWNAILGRILNTLPVRVTVDGKPFPAARVVAVADQGGESAVAIEAVPPYPGVETYTVVGVTRGTWKLFAFTDHVHGKPLSVSPGGDGRAEPFVADREDVELPGRVMPDLTGMPVAAVLGALRTVNLSLEESRLAVYDVTTGFQIQVDYFTSNDVYTKGARVVWHEPVSGELFDPATVKLRVFIGAPTAWTSVPSISGGTSFADAESKLRQSDFFVSPASRAAHAQNPSYVVAGIDPPGDTTNRPIGAYIDLALRAP